MATLDILVETVESEGFIEINSLVMFPEGRSVIIVRRYHEINIKLYLIFGQYFG